MPQKTTSISAFLASYHPFDLLPGEDLSRIEAGGTTVAVKAGDAVYEIGDKVDCLFVLLSGEVDLLSPEGQIISHFRQGESFAARTLFRGGIAAQKAVAGSNVRALKIPKSEFDALLAAYPGFSAFFDRLRPTQTRPPTASIDAVNALISSQLSEIMTADPVMVSPSATVREAAAVMGEKGISCVLVGDGGSCRAF